MGHADLLLGDAADASAAAGHADEAHSIELDVIGRNALDGRWTFQVVEEFDDLCYRPIQTHLRGPRGAADGGEPPRVRIRAQGEAPNIEPYRPGAPAAQRLVGVRRNRSAARHPTRPPVTWWWSDITRKSKPATPASRARVTSPFGPCRSVMT